METGITKRKDTTVCCCQPISITCWVGSHSHDGFGQALTAQVTMVDCIAICKHFACVGDQQVPFSAGGSRQVDNWSRAISFFCVSEVLSRTYR